MDIQTYKYTKMSNENIKRMPNFRTCKICEDHMPIEKFKRSYSKISVESRKHICEDCDKEQRKIKNHEYYKKKKMNNN